MNSCQRLNNPAKYLFELSSTHDDEQCYILAAHINWTREVISENKVPSKFQLHERLTDDEVYAFLSQGKSQPFGPKWIFLHLTILRCKKSPTCFFKKPSDFPTSHHSPHHLTWPQILDSIGESNFNFVWEQPYISLLPRDNNRNNESISSSDYVETDEVSYMSKLLKHLYINLEQQQEQQCATSTTINSSSNIENSRFPVSNLSQALAILNITSSSSTFIIFHPYVPYTLQDAVTFSPQKLTSSVVKQMFILYQILQYLKDIQSLSLPTGDLTLHNFRTDDCLYLSVIPSLKNILNNCKLSNSVNSQLKNSRPVDPRVQQFLEFVIRKVRWKNLSSVQSTEAHDSKSDESFYNQITPDLIELVIRHWCENLVSNYDYLLFLNFLAGRYCDNNPNYHPCFPWVADLSVESGGGWRDLTKSKFRLNKGERQLDLMYEDCNSKNIPTTNSSGSTQQQSVPHHVTDVLSEITYYVYKARRTKKEVLCKFVRPQWVPAEYPISIQRMQEWTPDESIPEFYDDPTIFQSIHDDLPDLDIPTWAKSPADFVKQHRNLLESEVVSAKLHHWI